MAQNSPNNWTSCRMERPRYSNVGKKDQIVSFTFHHQNDDGSTGISTATTTAQELAILLQNSAAQLQTFQTKGSRNSYQGQSSTGTGGGQTQETYSSRRVQRTA